MKGILPVSVDNGFPQKKTVVVDNVSYSVFLQRNVTEGFVTIALRRVSDGVLLSKSKLVEDGYLDVPDNATGNILFTLYCRNVSNMEVWII